MIHKIPKVIFEKSKILDMNFHITVEQFLNFVTIISRQYPLCTCIRWGVGASIISNRVVHGRLGIHNSSSIACDGQGQPAAFLHQFVSAAIRHLTQALDDHHEGDYDCHLTMIIAGLLTY